MRIAPLLVAAVLLPACTVAARDAAPTPTRTGESPVTSGTPSVPPTGAPYATPSGSPVAAPVRPVPRGFSPRSASFVSDTHGWVLGATGKTSAVVETRDGGRTWSLAGTLPIEVADGTDRPHVRQLRFLNERVGWAYGHDAYVTRDGGATWRAVGMPGGRRLVSVDASGDRTYALLGHWTRRNLTDLAVWTGTVSGDLFTRADSGGARTWTDDVVVRGRTVLFATWTGYRVSNDAGRTWATRKACPSDMGVQSIAAPTERDVVFSCVALDEHGYTRSVRVSHDGGRTTTNRLHESAWAGGDVAASSPTTITRALGPEPMDGRSESGRLQWSGDGGRTFRYTGPPDPAGGRMAMWTEPRFHPGGRGTAVRRVGDAYAVYVTVDEGRSWVRLAIR